MSVSQPERLLVVDDDANNRDMLSRRLTRRGYAVDVAEDGREAMEKIRQAHYDLVVLDQMTAGANGPASAGSPRNSLDLLRLLRATHSASDLPVILVAGDDQSESVVEALNGGANDYVVKPVDLPVVAARIEAQLARSKSERQVRESQQRYSLAARGSNDGLWDWDLAAGSMYYSPRWKSMLGYSEEDIADDPEAWLMRVHPDDQLRVRQQLRAHLDNETPEFHSEHRIRNREGQYRWMLARGAALRSGDGKPLRMAGSLTDISSSKISDQLTGLGNRLMLLERLAALTAGERHSRGCFTILLLDLDGFKTINDSFGHRVGDRILVEVAARIQKVVAESGALHATQISRIASDEFTILIERLERVEHAQTLAGRILESIRRPMCVEGLEISVNASIGMAADPAANATPEDLLRDADLAMYRAKELGKNRWQMFEPDLRERAQTRMALIHDLRYAIERRQLGVFYQPKLDLGTRTIVGFEALLRWNHPTRGLIFPADFIGLAEETGLIVPIGEWVLNEACRQLAHWQQKFPVTPQLSMNVNLSVKQLGDPKLLNRVRAILAETGVPPPTLKLELTETALMTELASVKSVLAALQALHVGLKLDDFGTGYASLAYLRGLHFDSLKIDKSFVMRMDVDTESRAIVETIVKLAHALDMTVVAEGIEEEAQLSELLRLGCDIGQGFYFSQALVASQAEKLLEDSLHGKIFEHSRLLVGAA